MAENSAAMLMAPEELSKRLDQPDQLVVDLSEAATHAAGHIPGAVHLDYEALLRAEGPVLGLVPDAAALARTLGAVGINDDVKVIAYDDEGNGRAARLLWMLAALGHSDHALLDGGLVAWRQAQLPLVTELASPTPVSYHARFRQPQLIASCEQVLAAIDDPGTVILDNRGADEYRGENVRAARAGHIPGAIHLDWIHAMDSEGDLRLKPAEQLRTDFEAVGVSADKTVITHCQTHHRSSLTLFALRYLGYPDVRGYAGSWAEWGNRDDTPIVNGEGR
jgi:thiosulfate/3-mercaptopyruvate sulfurtransferase